MGKYLGTDLFLELLVQVSAADPESVTSRSLAGVEVDPEISLEWQTPFFQLEWAFFPTDPETLFLTDNTFRFFWEYSY
jgi:translocation and assembly module TamB